MKKDLTDVVAGPMEMDRAIRELDFVKSLYYPQQIEMYARRRSDGLYNVQICIDITSFKRYDYGQKT